MNYFHTTSALLSLNPATAQWVLNKIAGSDFVAADPSTKVRTNRSPLQELESSLIFYENKRFNVVNRVARIYLDSNEIDSTILLLESQNAVRASCALVPILVANNQTKLNTHLQLIRDYTTTLGEGEAEKINELLKFCEYYEYIAPITARPGGYLAMTPDEIDILKGLSKSKTPIASNANAILNFVGEQTGYHKIEPFVITDGVNKKMSTFIEEDNKEEELHILAYPNPNNGNFIVEGNLPANQSTAIFVISDVNGKLIKEIKLEGNSFRNTIFLENATGIYFYNILINGNSEYRGKIIVQ